MARANRKAIDSSNFWNGHWVHGRYTAKPKINAKETKARQKVKRNRIRKEQGLVKLKHFNCHVYDIMINAMNRMTHEDKPTKKQKTHNQIQYGVDLANWWNEQHE